jgi:site-specific DNA-methyltransferase (adenine-specific)
MDPYFVSDGVTIYHGDCRDIIATLPDNSIDAIVTDPPYGIEFMGKQWDAFAPEVSASTAGRTGRTTARNDGGMHAHSLLSGSTLPTYGGARAKTLRCTGCGKRDQFRNAHACTPDARWLSEVINPHSAPGNMIGFQEWCETWAAECLRVLKPGGHMLAFGGTRTYHRLACAIENAGFEIRDSIHWLYGQGFPKSMNISKQIDKAAGVERERQEIQKRDKPSVGIHASGYGAESFAPQVDTPITAEAAAWQGWGTALKPAHEPIVLARKPLIGTVTHCVLNYGTGGINIDGTRIGVDGGGSQCEGGDACQCGHGYSTENAVKHAKRTDETFGRFPSNVLLDEHTAELLDQQVPDVARFFYCAKPSTAERDAGLHELDNHELPGVLRGRLDGGIGNEKPTEPRKNFHPTVKPIALMRYLCRLITPPGGTILEPFTGSGTTIAAAVFEGFNVIGCEMTEDYLPIIVARTKWAQTTNPDNPNTKPATPENVAPTLF